MPGDAPSLLVTLLSQVTQLSHAVGEMRSTLDARSARMEDQEAAILNRLDRIDQRLDAGDKRFKDHDIASAQKVGFKTALAAVGAAVMAALATAGSVLWTYSAEILAAVRLWLTRGP